MSGGNPNIVEIRVHEWPQNLPLRSIEYLSDIFYQQKLWKFIDKSEVWEHIKSYEQQSIFWNFKNDIEAYKEDTMLIGENPFAANRTLFLARTVDTYNSIMTTLTTLRDTYEARVSRAKTCAPREWFSYGSEKEVDEARVETTREKISVEWIGNLEKRYEGVNFVDADPDPVQFISRGREFPKIIRKTRLDIGVQVSVRFRSTCAQTDTYEIAREFIESEDAWASGDDMRIQQSASEETPPASADIQKIRYTDDVSLNYYKSFINMDKRTKKISSIAWHPVKSGYIAVAYINGIKDLEDRVITAESGHRLQQPITQKTRKTVHENDIEVNDSVFDVISRKQSVYAKLDQTVDEDSGSESESIKDDSNGENEEEIMEEDRFDISTFLVYKPNSTSTATSAHNIPQLQRDQGTSEFTDTDLKWASDLLQTESKSASLVLVEDDNSSDTAESIDSIDSESSLCSMLKPEPSLRAPLYEDTRSEDTDSIEDEIPITDTDSSVLLWNCENDLTPELNLYNVHDINIIKFYPLNGNLLAGGSCSGQLVIWDIHDDMEKSKRRQQQQDRQKYVSEFMENLPGWEEDDSKCPLVHPTAISKRNISHVDKITNLEWMHPSLKLSPNGSGVFVKTESDPSKELITSSLDGSIKVWQIHSTHTSGESSLERGHIWDLQLIYNMLITIPKLEKYSLAVKTFKISVPSVRYVSATSTSYEYVPEIDKKITSSILIANTIGELGAIKFPDRKDAFIDGSASKSAENCKHEWWATCHDDSISSLSQNYFFPQIALSTGGRIFAFWKVDFKNGPIWWKQYPVDVSLTDGCFTPYHPGIVYIARSDGMVDLWDLTKQVHEPVMRVKASGYQINAISVIIPPCPEHQISIADSNGIFHILNNRYETTWSEDDFKTVQTFFKRAEECKKQLLYWNKHWKELSTTTDQYGFQYKPEPMKRPKAYSAKKKPKHGSTEASLVTEKLIEPTDLGIPFLQQIATSHEIRTLLQKILDDLKTLPDLDHSSQSQVDDPASTNAIRNLYLKCLPE